MTISYREWIRWLCFAVKFLCCCHYATAVDGESMVGTSIRYAKGNLNDKKECVSKDFSLLPTQRIHGHAWKWNFSSSVQCNSKSHDYDLKLSTRKHTKNDVFGNFNFRRFATIFQRFQRFFKRSPKAARTLPFLKTRKIAEDFWR